MRSRRYKILPFFETRTAMGALHITARRLRELWARGARYGVATLLTVLLCPFTHTVAANLVISTLTVFASPDSNERTSLEEELRECSAHPCRQRICWTKDGNPIVASRLPERDVRPSRFARRPSTSPLSTACLGAGLYIRC
jgi:hypothetical protein